MIELERLFQCWMACAIVFAAFLAPNSATAQDLSPRERELMRVIEDLKQRVENLERRVFEPAKVDNPDEPVEVLDSKKAPTPATSANDFRAYWKEGLRLDSTNGKFKLKIGGRIQQDFAWIEEGNDLPEADSGAEFRRTYLTLSGDIYDDFAFKFQFAFTDDGSARFRDVWIGANNVPYLGHIRVGHFKEPFSINELTSDNDITLLERGLPNAFVPSRNMGIMATNAFFDNRATWAIGIFQNTDARGASVDKGDPAFTGRLTGLPWYQKDGRKLLHLGATFSYRNIDDDEFSFAQSPEVHLAPKYLDTGDFSVDDQILINSEIAVVYGPFSAVGEYIYTKLDTPSAMGDPSFDGYYIALSYFLTGEHLPYKNSSGSFGRVKPKRPFRIAGERGPGAWELALRYSSLDLNDAIITGGEEENITAGVNWYLNPNMRIMLNYVYGDIELPSGIDDDFHAVQSRFQVTF